MFKRILVAVDETPLSAHAAGVAAELAAALGAEVALLHVVTSSEGLAPDVPVPAGELVAAAERDAQRLLADLGRRFRTEPLRFVPFGRPVHEIVAAAKTWPADLVVVGSHGRGRMGTALLGSVADGVVRGAPCPVLVVRAST